MVSPGGIGPGARPTGNGPASGPMLTLPAGSLVINPNPVGGGGGGTPRPIDPYGGRR